METVIPWTEGIIPAPNVSVASRTTPARLGKLFDLYTKMTCSAKPKIAATAVGEEGMIGGFEVVSILERTAHWRNCSQNGKGSPGIEGNTP